MKLIRFIKNKYFWVALFFVAWLFFFDKNNFFDQWKQRQTLNKVEQEANYYKKEIEKNKKEKEELFSSEKNLEKFAREKYMMKKSDEDLIIIIDTTKKEMK